MTHRSAILTIGSPGGVRHQDVFICTACRSRIALCDEKYLFTDRHNSLEAEGPPSTSGAW